MVKTLTISIAAYNVEKFLNKTLDSLIIKNMDLLEVLIVNDGSKDKTLEIAKRYEKKYPQTFKVINKENGGYGSTINAGIKNATGKYFKQLDGDDWYVTDNLNKLCQDLEKINEDMIYTPYITHHIGTLVEETIDNNIENYSKLTKLDDVINNCIPEFAMHNLTFKTEILKNKNITIDENCFYTDTEYIVFPLIYCNTIKILDYPIYVYRIGDVNQSVGRLGRIKHQNDHYRMSYSLLEKYNQIEKTSNNVKDYLDNYLASVFASGVANYLMVLKPNIKNYKLIKKYNKDIKKTSLNVYKLMNKKSKTVHCIRNFKFPAYFIINKLKEIRGR